MKQIVSMLTFQRKSKILAVLVSDNWENSDSSMPLLEMSGGT